MQCKCKTRKRGKIFELQMRNPSICFLKSSSRTCPPKPFVCALRCCIRSSMAVETCLGRGTTGSSSVLRAAGRTSRRMARQE